MKIEFFIAMIPPTVTHQEKAVKVVHGKPVFYEPAKLADARAKLKAHLFSRRPVTPLAGPVLLKVLWKCPSAGKHKEGDWRDPRPDTDNLQKLLKDVMTDLGFWKDDAQVCAETVGKIWADRPGIYILAEELQP